jgi:hypothetical protein
MNNKVQAGANTQFGGVNVGLFSVKYHPSSDGVTKKVPSSPASCGSIKAIDSFLILIFFIEK